MSRRYGVFETPSTRPSAPQVDDALRHELPDDKPGDKSRLGVRHGVQDLEVLEGDPLPFNFLRAEEVQRRRDVVKKTSRVQRQVDACVEINQ